MDGSGFGAIAEGPTRRGATDVVYDSWVDGRDGVNNEHVLLSYSRTVAQTGRLRRPRLPLGRRAVAGRDRHVGVCCAYVAGARGVAHTNHAGRWFADCGRGRAFAAAHPWRPSREWSCSPLAPTAA